MDFQREMGRFKVNEHGELVDMRELSFDQLQSLLVYYEGKLKRARSRDMQIAYKECIKQIRNFMVDNLIQDKMDVFSLAHYMGLRDVRSMIKTYLGSLKTEEETAKDIIKQRFEQRKKIYSGCDLPNDRIIREIFNLLTIEKLENLVLSNIQKAANIFADHYNIQRPNILLESDAPSEIAVFYNIDYKTIHLYLDKIRGGLAMSEFMIKGLFEHLCEVQSWRFHQDPIRSFELQREETERYAELFINRCASMGLLKRKK